MSPAEAAEQQRLQQPAVAQLVPPVPQPAAAAIATAVPVTGMVHLFLYVVALKAAGAGKMEDANEAV
jgi:hypothetical protein